MDFDLCRKTGNVFFGSLPKRYLYFVKMGEVEVFFFSIVFTFEVKAKTKEFLSKKL